MLNPAQSENLRNVSHCSLTKGGEPVRPWGRQAKVHRLGQENRELKSANKILRSAANFFEAKPDREGRLQPSLLAQTRATLSSCGTVVSRSYAESCSWRQAGIMRQETVPTEGAHSLMLCCSESWIRSDAGLGEN